MNATENQHEWFSHQLATYLAGGLSDAAERARFEAHASSCDRCAADLHHAQQLEGKMSELFAFGIPDSDFEQRIATRLRFRLDKRQWVNPKVRKAAIAAAAVLMFGAAGYVAQNFAGDGKLPSFDTSPTQFAMGLKDRLMGSTGDQIAVAAAPFQQGTAPQSPSTMPSATLRIGAFGGRTTGTSGGLTVIPKTGGLNPAEVITPSGLSSDLSATANHGILAPYVAADVDGDAVKDNAVMFAGGRKLSSDGAGTTFFENDSVAFDNASGKRAIRVQNGGTFRLGTLDHVPQNTGTITTAARDLLRTTDSGGTNNVADGRERIYWAGGRVVDTDAAVAISPNATLTSNVGQFNMGGQNRQILTANGTGVFSGPLTGGTMTKTGPGYVTLNPGAENGLSAISTAGDGQVELKNQSSGIVTVNTANATLTKTGAGALALTGTNSFTGGTTVSLGTVKPGHDQIVSAAGSTNSPRGGRIDLNGFARTIDELNSTGTVAVNNANTFTGNTTISSNAPTYVFHGAGKITGDATLKKTGEGTLVIQTNNDYTGGTIIDGGTMALRYDDNHRGAAGAASSVSSGKLPTNTVTTSAGTLDFAAPGQASAGTGNSLQRLAQGAVIDGKVSVGNIALLTSGGTANAAVERQLDIRGTNFYGVNVGTRATSADANGVEARGRDSVIAMAGGGVSLRADGTANLSAPKVNVGNGNVVLSLDGKDPLSNFITSSGTGNLIVNSPTSQVQFNNASSNYSRLTVQAGTVQLNASNQSPKDGTLTVSGSGAFDMNASRQTLASSGSIQNTGAGTNHLVVTNGDMAFDGGFANPARVVVEGGNPAAINRTAQSSSAAGATSSNGGSVAISGAGKLDLTKNNMVLDYAASTLTTNGKVLSGNGNLLIGNGTLAMSGNGTLSGQRTSTAGTGSTEYFNNGGALAIKTQPAPGIGTVNMSGNFNPAMFPPEQMQKLLGQQLVGNGSGTLLSSSGTIQLPSLSTPKAISIDGPFDLTGRTYQAAGNGVTETASETRAFKPADALALNQPAKPQAIENIQAGVNPNGLVVVGNISSKPTDGAQARLQSLQSDGQLRSSTYTPIDTLQSSVPAQVSNGVGAGDRTPAAGQLNQVYGGTDPSQTTRNQSQGSLATRDQIAQAVSQPVGGPAGDANSGRAVVAAAQANAAAARRVIREGTMEFEVDSFDSTFNQIATIVGEEGGFIAAADSDKLPNGKVRGMVTVRVPPDRLDLLVLKLRALGELKSQKLGSRDVGKEYTDIESELRAARAMEARLLEMIAKAQGKVAELLEAEKELATWRTKIEKMTGTLNYYNNLISMATLNLQLYEKDIRTPASANITEEISTGVETEDVEVARNAALKAIDEAKGRIIESNLQKLEAGQFAAKIIAEVAPENAGPIIDRLKQLGRLARYDVQKKQTNEGAKNATGAQSQAPVRLETIPTRIVISLYNLANVAPRLTNNLNIAGDDVEAVYRAILKRVNDVGGRVVSSNLNRQDRAQVSGTMQFEIKAADADAVLNDVRLQGIVLRMVVNENPDTANVTTAKQAFVLSIIPTAQLSAKHFANMNLAAEDVEAAYGAILKRINASAGSRVISSNLNRQDAAQINGTIQFELKSEDADAVINDLRLQGLVLRMNVGENADGVNVTTVKRSYTLQVVPMATLSPKLTTNLNLAAADVEGMYNSILKIVSASGGSRVLSSNLSRQDATQAVGSLQFEVKSDEAPAVLSEIRKNVQVLQLNLLENPDNANVTTAKQSFVVQIIPTSQVQPREVRDLGIQTSEVESAVQIVTASVANVGGRMIDSNLSQDKNGTTIAHLAIEVPLDKAEQIADLIRKQGTVRSTNSQRNTQIPDGPLSRARLNVTLATGETIVPSEGGFGNSIREGLSTSVKGLLWSLQLIVIGVCLVAPWLLLMWGGWRFLKKRKRATPGV